MKLTDFLKDTAGKASSGRLIALISFFVAILLTFMGTFGLAVNYTIIYVLFSIAGGLKIADRFGKEKEITTTEFEVDNSSE